jgi:hypothetical protein
MEIDKCCLCGDDLYTGNEYEFIEAKTDDIPQITKRYHIECYEKIKTKDIEQYN